MEKRQNWSRVDSCHEGEVLAKSPPSMSRGQVIQGRAWLAVLGLLRWCGMTASLAALISGVIDAEEPRGWKTRVAVDWEEVPLRQALGDLARQQDVTVFLDRRVDPDRRVTLAHKKPLPLPLLLEHLAQQLDAEIVPVGSVLYWVPSGEGARIAGRLVALERKCREVWPELRGRRVALSWESGARPRELVHLAAERFGIELRGAETIPHDVWWKAHLPPLSAPQLLTLLTSGLGRTFVPEPKRRATLVAWEEVAVTGHSLFFADKKVVSSSELRRAFPRVRWQRSGSWWVAIGESVDRGAIVRYLMERNEAKRTSARTEERYTLTVREQPVGAILKTLQDQGWRLQIEAEAQERLTRRVSFDVRRVPIEELLAKVLAPVGLQYRLEGDTIVVRVASSGDGR